MSLLHQNRSFSTGDYLFIAAGLLGLLGFFMIYGSQDPRSMIDTTLDKQSAVLKAAEMANTLGYNFGNYQTEAGYGVDQELLDSLQVHLGRSETIERFSASPPSDLFPFFWEVRFSKTIPAMDEIEIRLGQGPGPRPSNPGEIGLRLAPGGQWIGLVNGAEMMPDQPLHREALRYAIRSDSLWRRWSLQPDSTWKAKLSFEREGGYELGESGRTVAREADSGSRYRFSRDELLRLAAYYIGQAGWDPERFQVSDIQVETTPSTTIARIRHTRTEPVLGQNVTLQTAVLPSGALVELKATYNEPGSPINEFPSLWALSGGVAIFLFIIGSIVIFYFRIRARVIDTRSALVIGIVAGFIVPVVIFLNQADDIRLFGEGSTWLDLLGLGLQMGISGAFSAVGFFVVSAISDSVTRQYWPEKLDCYDYLRQGMVFNKPVGETLVRAVVLSGILAGFWATLLTVFPHLYLETDMAFLSHEALWAPLYLLLDNFWYSLMVVMGIFLVVGSQAYGRTGNRWIAGSVMVLSVALVGPLPLSMGPGALQFFVLSILGAALTVIFLRWDFLTLLVTHYLFSCLLVASGGWMIGDSPDLYPFLTFVLFVLLFSAGGALFIAMGKEERSLPDYVPAYVEELAQEERIKQELQIARDVQQSFLPAQTPAVGNLNIAALCKPAYETGGDYYDFILLDEHRLAVAIGDVSGKGIQAAFYMTFTKGMLHSLCRETESPAELLKKANRLFYDNATRGTFVSLIYGIIDTRERTFRFARAGHNPLMHVKADTGETQLLQPNGLGLGLTVNAAFDDNIQETTLHLAAGDTLLLYTDGIVEALNTARQFYGTQRLLRVLGQNKGEDADRILSSLIDDVAKFSGRAKQHDDMTVMVIRFEDENRA